MAASLPMRPASRAARPSCARRSAAICSAPSPPATARWQRWPAMCWRDTRFWPDAPPPSRGRAPSTSRIRSRPARRVSVDRSGTLPDCAALLAARTSTMPKTPVPQAEYPRPIAADQIGPQETEREIAANAVERARLAERFGLLALDTLTATLSLKRGRGGLIQVRGRFEAEVVQACVVTLEPVRAHLDESFSIAFGTGGIGAGEVVIGLEEEDPPEELTEGRIDLGETVAQQLAVALDPYPHAPGAGAASEESPEADDRAAEKRASPFAALSQLRRPRN